MFKTRQQQALTYELKFYSFCRENKLSYVYLDTDNAKKEIFLKNPGGKSPDFLCYKNSKNIFVEVKTHTILTSESRHKKMVQAVLEKKNKGLSGTTIFEPFNPIPELKVVFDGYLRSSSRKFKNIKDDYNFPRVLLLDGIQIEEIDICRIYLGLYWNVDEKKFIKKHSGLLDSTGSSVSAIVSQL